MPKIVIREKDETTAGTIPGANFSVVVPGIAGYKKYSLEEKSAGDAEYPCFIEEEDGSRVFYKDQYTSVPVLDENNVYECSDPSKFVAYIGKAASISTGDVSTITSYGNQIAYHLLQLGYTVFYKVVDSDAELAQDATYACFKEKSIYDFRYIVNGLLKDNSAANNCIAAVAANRGDCVALLDVDENLYTGSERASAIDNLIEVGGTEDQNSAWFAPSVFYSGIAEEAYADNDKLPGSFHYLACASKSFDRYPEWYAVSGYKRGVANMTIKGVSYKFGDSAVQALQPRTGSGKAINLIIKLKNEYYLWGNRTAYGLDGTGLIASHFLNIRQLCITLKKQIYLTCRHLTFDPNSDELWRNFCGELTPVLDNMRLTQGIRDYAIVQLPTTLKAKLFAAIRIVPIEAVEDFEIEIKLEDNLDNPTIVVTESLGEYGRVTE